MKAEKIPASTRQQEYLLILFQDLGFTNCERRKFLEEDYHVSHIDELNFNEASKLINDFIERKLGKSQEL